MLKGYHTIKEVVGPLMLVEGVSGVTYNELVEIHQSNGEVRSGKVLEVDGDKAMVQLFESSNGLRISDSTARFLGRGIELSVSMTCSAAFSTAWASQRMAARSLFPKCGWISTASR